MTTSTRGAAKAPAVLVLEDGRIFRGRAYGAVGETFGEAVFSTGMTGYQETLTDPSYHRQVVVMTAPHVGNTGVNDEDPESAADLGRRLRRARPRARALQLALPALPGRRAGRAGRRRHQRHRHPRPHPPPARARRHARRHLLRRRRSPTRPRCSPGPAGPRDDGRRPVRRGRHQGAVRRARAVGEKRFTVAAIDLGIKGMTPHRMAERGIEVHVLPATATVEDVYAVEPGRRLLLQRPRRPGHRRPPRHPSIARQSWSEKKGEKKKKEVKDEWVLSEAPAVRHLLRQPDPRPRARLRHLQAEVRPPRHQPARAGPHAPARSRSPRTTTASPSTRRSTRSPTPRTAAPRSPTSASTTTWWRACSCSTSPAFCVQYHPEAAAGPHDAAYLFDRFVITLDGGPACLSAPISSPSWSSAPARSSSARPPSSTTPAPRPAASSRPRACGSSWSTPTRRRS